ncbi:MAG: protein kinase domain-containing protein [Gemmatimonadaceae bacterium]
MTDVLTRLTTTLAERYRVERELGAGGMATVYLAHDVRHDRDVAIKVLHPDLGAALGSERFLSEIRTTARLQHPHILPLLDSGETDGLLYYVMPYVTGETLRTRIDRERQLPIDDALRIAREIADALGEAHSHGIVHRDIKPENILLHGGHALVADFGIALAVQSAGGHRITQTGLSLGTPQYMSPEQAMGERTIDARSDIYSLGAVTYEMLVGDPPFGGSTVQAIVAKVLTERPTAPTAIRDTIPSSVERAVLRALNKLPADRFATAEKFVEALAVTDGGLEAERRAGTRAAPSPKTRRSRVADLAVLAAAMFLAVVVTWSLVRRGAAPGASWSSYTQLTDASGVETAPTLSPDGQYFAYASDAHGTFDIYVQRVGGRAPVLVAGDSTTDEMWPAYSPDGQRIAYNVRGGGIFVVGATGESARRLTTVGANPAWSPDGKLIAFGSEEVRSAYNVNAGGTLWIVDVAGGEPRRIDRGWTSGLYQPAWSPSGERIAFWSTIGGQRDLETVRIDGSDRVKVTNDAAVDFAPAWSADGKSLYFASDRGGTMGLWRIGIDQSSGQPGGAPVPIASGVDVAMDLPHPSADGTALLFRSMLETTNPAAITFDPARSRIGDVRLLQNRTGTLSPTDVSPDGRWVALANTFDRQQDIFIMHPDGTVLTRLTDDAARDWEPRFTPDGKGLVFYSNLSGKYDAWSIRLDGSGRTRLSDIAPGIAFSMFAPDGTRLVSAGLPHLMMIGSAPWPMTLATTKPREVRVRDGEFTPTYWSHGGRWISGYVTRNGGDVIGFALLDVTTGKAQQLNDDSRGYDLAWLPDNQRVVYFTNQGHLVMQDVVTLERRELAGSLPFPPELTGGVIASPDGRTLYYAARQSQANIWIVRRASPTAP